MCVCAREGAIRSSSAERNWARRCSHVHVCVRHVSCFSHSRNRGFQNDVIWRLKSIYEGMEYTTLNKVAFRVFCVFSKKKKKTCHKQRHVTCPTRLAGAVSLRHSNSTRPAFFLECTKVTRYWVRKTPNQLTISWLFVTHLIAALQDYATRPPESKEKWQHG